MNIFVSLPFQCQPEMCWVDIEDDVCDVKQVKWWKAWREGMDIVTCRCGNPAVQLDHFYPFFSDKNKCSECLNRIKETSVVKAQTMAVVRQHNKALQRTSDRTALFDD